MAVFDFTKLKVQCWKNLPVILLKDVVLTWIAFELSWERSNSLIKIRAYGSTAFWNKQTRKLTVVHAYVFSYVFRHDSRDCLCSFFYKLKQHVPFISSYTNSPDLDLVAVEKYNLTFISFKSFPKPNQLEHVITTVQKYIFG
jgi:hypothetical protein